MQSHHYKVLFVIEQRVNNYFRLIMYFTLCFQAKSKVFNRACQVQYLKETSLRSVIVIEQGVL